MREFQLTLHKAYYAQGFFNVPVEVDKGIGPDEERIVLLLGIEALEIEGKVNRRAQPNGTARIMGGSALKHWFHEHCEQGEVLAVRILSPTRMVLRNASASLLKTKPTKAKTPSIWQPSVARPQRFTRLPVVSLSAEYLIAGHLMRRNILTYKAPPGNEGYDLICIHPDPRKAARPLRIQVKSRFATDCDRGFLVNSRSFGAFDYLIVAFLNIGYFLQMSKRHPVREGDRPPEFYTFTPEFVREHHRKVGKWEKVLTRSLDIEKFRDGKGFDLIADALGIEYPEKIPGGA